MAPSPPDLVATLFCKIWTTAMLELTNLCTSLLLVCYCLSFGDFSQFISPFARSSPYFVIRDTKWHRNFTCNGFTKNTWTCSNVLLDCIDLNRAPDKTDWCRYNRSVVGFAAPRICPVKYKNQISSMYNHSDWRRVCDPDRKDLVGRG